MSRVTKRKHVMNESMWDDHQLPKENQTLVRVLKCRGNNLHEVSTSNGEKYLVSMPRKFRNIIWVKRGSYVLVEPILEGDKVKAEIVKIMNEKSIKYYKENNIWPKEFYCEKKDNVSISDDLFVNPNRLPIQNDENDSDSSESSECSDSSECSQ